MKNLHLFGVNSHKCKADLSLLCQYIYIPYTSYVRDINMDLRKHSTNKKLYFANTRPMKNDILQSVELDLVNINVYAKFYQNIPHGKRVTGNFYKLSRHAISQTDRGHTI